MSLLPLGCHFVTLLLERLQNENEDANDAIIQSIF